MAAKYYIKQRSLNPARFNPFNPRKVLSRGPWKTVASYDSESEALDAFDQMNTDGLTMWALTYKGSTDLLKG